MFDWTDLLLDLLPWRWTLAILGVLAILAASVIGFVYWVTPA
jgi:hypothetical protein